MEIISHRGFWHESSEKNTVTAFNRSLNAGFGIETDIRDANGELVIAHDLPTANEQTVGDFFEQYNSFNTKPTLALNIKADGLQQKLKELLKQHHIEHYFVFDMSVPDGLVYLKHDITAFTRQSEYEASPLSFYENAAGVWIDCFNSDWIQADVIAPHLEANKKVCIVSPELHKREHITYWAQLKASGLTNSKQLMLCTDFPEQARKYFNE